LLSLEENKDMSLNALLLVSMGLHSLEWIDDVLVDVARLYADEYQALWQKSGATSCYDYASGTTDRNYSEELPEVLVKREQELNERVVRTAAKRAPVPEASLEPIRNKLRQLGDIRRDPSSRSDDLLVSPTVRQRRLCWPWLLWRVSTD
jgi:hypothetical protein